MSITLKEEILKMYPPKPVDTPAPVYRPVTSVPTGWHYTQGPPKEQNGKT
jgi:hypothetical protein